ncbi:D-alanyl-D-alanine carboxypeptidase family protein [Sphingomonas sp. RHCKR47]|uniref:D-alanyl-D-alanine carboxypeptidase family protein n=1 Tax=Sphingomonas citricola TaxID=2862498 RepID=UPI001CA53669|nr:D-alanyl-D-alanine carboxypeptidase family protein [Sphingomonas citricola]MBW6524418.1 D-alanyl-D-alanine carboxypeptidase family protein [Sphingomonas citricola]
MATRSVGFRLGTEGKANVVNDFAEVRMAGRSAMNEIADAAEDTARRATAANDEYTKRQLESWKRQADAAKLNAARADVRGSIDAALGQSGNGAQFATVNLDRSTGAAKESADVFRAVLDAEEKLEARTRALIAVIDPASVAQQRYNVAIAEARELYDLGRISTDQFAAAQTRAQAALDVGTGATKRAEVAAAALASMQARVNAAGDNGFGGWEGSAERSAVAFRALIAEQEELERRSRALRAAIDPAAAAQQRFDSEMAEARSLISQNAISLDEYAAKLRIEQGALDEATDAKKRNASASAQARQSGIMLGQQVQDFTVQVSSGQSITTAFTQQIGQAAFALQGMEGRLAGVAAFLTSWQGIVLTVLLTAAGPLVAKLLEGNDALADGVDKLREDAQAAEISRQAKVRFAASADGVAAAIRDGTEATKKSIDATKTSAEQDNIAAKQALQREINIRKVTLALLDQAKAEARQADATNFGAAGGAGAAAAQTIYRNRVADVEKMAQEQADLIAQAEARVQQTRIALASESAARATDPMARIKKVYDDQVTAAQAKARAEGTVTTELTRQLTQIERNRQAAIKAEQDKQSAANRKPTVTNQIGRNVTLAEAREIAEGIGGHINSDHRTREEQERLYAKYVAYKSGKGPWAALAAKPGTSNHELDQAIDVAKGNGVTLAKLIAAYRQAGVKLTEALDEGSHFHVAWKKTGGAAREAAAERTEAAKKVREAAAAERELEQDLTTTVRAFDPARAAADDYADSLKRIAALVSAGKLSLADSIDYARTARVQYLTGQNERFAADFKKLFGESDPMAGMMDAADREIRTSVDESADAMDRKAKITAAGVDEVRAAGVQLVDVFDPSQWDSWGSAGKSVLNMLKGEFIALALLNPLKNLINGNKNLPTLNSAISSISGLFSKTPAPGRNATGTEHWSGGMTYVNENGGEIMDLPTGTRIYPAAETRRMMAANDTASSRQRIDLHLNTDLFTATVSDVADQRVGVHAPGIAAGGAELGRDQMRKAQRRKMGRR